MTSCNGHAALRSNRIDAGAPSTLLALAATSPLLPRPTTMQDSGKLQLRKDGQFLQLHLDRMQGDKGGFKWRRSADAMA